MHVTRLILEQMLVCHEATRIWWGGGGYTSHVGDEGIHIRHVFCTAHANRHMNYQNTLSALESAL
jgi:hypothetical protein